VDPFCAVIVYAVVDDSLSRHLLGDSIDVFVRREDAERFIEDVRGDDPELAKPLRIEGARATGPFIRRIRSDSS
jgi:hypothetical protein